VLGCTHFPLIATSLKDIFNGADLIDSAYGIAERVQMLGADSLCQGASKRFFATEYSPPPWNFLRQFGLSKPKILQMPLLAV
jgi:glutamate racemase